MTEKWSATKKNRKIIFVGLFFREEIVAILLS
jgi:hypothetical protein